MSLTLTSAVQTAAATSIFLALLAFGITVYLLRLYRGANRLRGFFWLIGICMAGIAGLIGGVMYVFSLAEKAVFDGLYVFYGICQIFPAGLFLCGAVYDFYGPEISLRMLAYLLVASAVCYLIGYRLALAPVSIAVFGTAAMLAVFIFYSWLATRFYFPGARWMSFGAVLFLLAAWLQTNEGLQLNFVWSFDFYAVSNVMRGFSLLALALGLRSSLRSSRRMQVSEIPASAEPHR
jgi:hypothetical protein